MRARQDLKLRRVGDHNLLVDQGTAESHDMDIYDMNETAASMWRHLQQDCTIESLAQAMMDEYGIDHERAVSDVTAQIDEWHEYGILDD